MIEVEFTSVGDVALDVMAAIVVVAIAARILWWALT